MSGIAGWAVPARSALEEGAVLPMLQSISHRHHAAETLLGYSETRRQQQVVLGATLCDPASGIALALDGSLAGADALRAQLAKKGFAFAGKSGAEVLLRAYQYWDKDVVRHLRGAFAFALWDPRKDRLMLARDRFGEKPLYVQERGTSLVFGSEAKALLAAPQARAELDRDALRECLARGYVPGGATLFRGVRKLPPASYAMWQFGRLQETRYWIPPDRDPRKDAHQGEQEEGFLSTLSEAVSLRGAGAGVLLSGGIDSAVLVAVLAQGGRKVKTFSLGFAGDGKSELPQAAAVAKHFATEHHEIVVKPADLLPGLGALVGRHDGPLAGASALAVHRLASEASRSVGSVLSGDGGDEIVGGYRKLVAERFHPGFCASMDARGEKWAQRLLPDAKKAGEGKKRPPHDVDANNSGLRRVLYTDQTTQLPDRLLERDDRAGGEGTAQIRLPYLDHRVAEYVSGLADDQRVRGFATKWILREAARKLVPAALGRRKAGFRMPIRDWLRNELRDTLVEHLQSGASRTRGYYDTEVLDRLVKEHVAGKRNHDTTLWTLLNLEIWHRRYGPA
jgi:asparagine synthase (glutamine-hydrolysing)